jgi:hypothetical protein
LPGIGIGVAIAATDCPRFQTFNFDGAIMASGNCAGVNILSKTDKSLAPTPAGKPTVKRTKFDWSTGGAIGSFAWIPKGDLNIDGRYQREQCSKEKVHAIARAWDWLLLGVISVIVRSDGTYWVFDGGHRTRASFFRDDVTRLPCIVHELDKVNDEAKAFVARNTMVSNVAAYDRFRASVCATEPTAVKTDAILNAFGLTLVKGGTNNPATIACIGAIQKIISEDYEAAKKVLGFCISIAGQHQVSGKVLSAMFTLQQHFKDNVDVIDRYREKLSRHSQREIEVKINQFSTECGRTGSVVGAKAILELVNHKSRSNRLEW